ncbi:MAG: MerR family DNA-binding transcriptional regulator [Actinobacteria bacterium]|uniref:Unannotated protein n=1 Tax=freshwater metagenome TaxID=449393 RepID=A0A6J6NH56_9ZZZZ|nr:MerR family DNA-binding transcriptional regulator [Actinomycetota bacterium]
MATYDDDPAAAGDGLSISQVSDRLGVPAPTLRSWERRYGLPTTTRTRGGHRRYRSPELVELRLMRDAIATGRSAGAAARWVRATIDERNPARCRIDDLLAAAVRQDQRAIVEVLDATHAALGLGPTLDDVLMPALRRVGAWWEDGRCEITQERLATETVRGWLARLVTLGPRPGSEQRVVVAIGPRDRHTVGTEALAALFAQERIGCRLLGARTSVALLASAAAAETACAVVVVSHLSTQRRPSVEALTAVAALGRPTFYAGNAFLLPSARVGVPGRYLGTTLVGAASLIRASARLQPLPSDALR